VMSVKFASAPSIQASTSPSVMGAKQSGSRISPFPSRYQTCVWAWAFRRWAVVLLPSLLNEYMRRQLNVPLFLSGNRECGMEDLTATPIVYS
jgi:hypothetical protein